MVLIENEDIIHGLKKLRNVTIRWDSFSAIRDVYPVRRENWTVSFDFIVRIFSARISGALVVYSFLPSHSVFNAIISVFSGTSGAMKQ